ncbi:hypothetical protein BaRGS_00005147 [Batillaria attramentaria]|uniref:CARD domain-containing protein n=1 Tax=Batillaria attramentaria TaxID=370345 RepID=A0ABD0LWY6_9CAEN
MNPAQKRAIQQNWTYLLEHITIEGTTLVDILYQKEILTDDHMELIRVQAVTKEKITKLLDILRRRGPNSFQGFLEALDESGQKFVADKLRTAFQPQDGQGGAMEM